MADSMTTARWAGYRNQHHGDVLLSAEDLAQDAAIALWLAGAWDDDAAPAATIAKRACIDRLRVQLGRPDRGGDKRVVSAMDADRLPTPSPEDVVVAFETESEDTLAGAVLEAELTTRLDERERTMLQVWMVEGSWKAAGRVVGLSSARASVIGARILNKMRYDAMEARGHVG